MQDNASGPIKKVGTTAAQTSDDIAKSMDKAGGAYEKFNEKSKRVSNDFQSQQKKLQLLKDKYVELYSTMGSGAAETQKVGTEIEELSGKVAKNKKVLEEAASAADSFDKSIEQVPNSLDKAGKSADGFGSSLEALIPKLTKAMLIKKSIEAVGDLAGQAVEQASTAETAFAKVSTLLADGTDTTAYFDSIKKGSQETGIAIGDFAEAVYSALSASVDQGQAVEFTTSAMKLAKGGFTDAPTAVDVLTTALNAYGLEASQATSISDKLITTQNLGKTTVGELGQVLGRSIPTARAYNVSIDELCAAYAVMTKNGSPAAESTTLINAMLNELGKSGTKAAEIIKDKTGKSFSQLMSEGVQLTDVLSILQSSASQSGLAINDLFGSAEAGRGANILLNNIGDVNSALSAMSSNVGATESAYSKVMDTFAEKTAKLKNNWNLLLEGIGEKLLPIASWFVDVLNSGFDKLFGNNPFKGQASSLEEATQKAQDYQAQIDAIYAKYDAGEEITNGDMYRINQLTAAMNSYLEQAEAFKNGTSEIAESAADPAEKFQEATETYTAAAEQLMQQMSDDYASAIDGLDKSSEAEAAAKATMDKFLGSINAGKSGVLSAMSGLGSQMTSALQSSLGPVTMTVDVQFVGGSMPGRAIGMDYVPYNGYVAELHRGEAILNSYEADQWRRGRSGGEGQGITIVQNIQAVPQTPVQMAEATAAYFEQARWM